MTKQLIAVRGAWEPGRRRRSAPVLLSLIGPTLSTFAVQQVVGYLGHTGRAADVVVTAAYDPKPPFVQASSCKRRGHNSLALAAYSITSSARNRNASGMVSPSAFAVLRLTTSSNRVGCRIGRSPGFSPFRIRPA